MLDRHALGMKQADDLEIGTRLAEQEALSLLASLGAQEAQFARGLDAFRRHGDAEAAA